MALIKTVQTLVKAGKSDLSLEAAVKNFNEKLFPAKSILGNTTQFAFFKEDYDSYLLMVSQPKEKPATPLDYNILLTVTSYSDKKNQEIAYQFEKETKINLNVPVPEQLKNLFANLNLSFKVFEKNPQEAMAIMRKETYN